MAADVTLLQKYKYISIKRFKRSLSKMFLFNKEKDHELCPKSLTTHYLVDYIASLPFF